MFQKKKVPEENRRMVRRQQSANVFSYHANRSSSDAVTGRNIAPLPPKRRRMPQVSWLQYAPSLFAAMALIVCLVYVSTLSTLPQILVVGSQDGQTLVRDTSIYETEAQEVLERSVLNRSKLLIDTNKLARELGETFPELGDISVILPLVGRRPLAEVRPVRPALVVSGGNDVFVVDERGRAIARAGEVESSIRDPLPVVRDESGLPIEKSKAILPQEVVEFVTTVAHQLRAKQVSVQSLTLPPSVNELHVRLEGKPYFVKFDLRGEGRQQAGAFLAVKDKLEKDNKTPAEYIDVRVPEKAFYK